MHIMPNYVNCRLSFTGRKNRIMELVGFISNSDEGFDFDLNRIIPMPESLQLDECMMTPTYISAILTVLNPITDDYYGCKKLAPKEFRALMLKAEELYPGQLDMSCCPHGAKITPQLIKSGRPYLDNIRKYGHATWHTWTLEHWGTKWNTIDSKFDKNSRIITFTAAGNIPEQALQTLSEKFPDVKLTLKWEEHRERSGVMEFENGKVIRHQEYDL